MEVLFLLLVFLLATTSFLALLLIWACLLLASRADKADTQSSSPVD